MAVQRKKINTVCNNYIIIAVYSHLYEKRKICPEAGIRYDVTASGLPAAVVIHPTNHAVRHQRNQTPE